MKKNNSIPFHYLSFLLLLAVSLSGCPSSNLDERPEEVKQIALSLENTIAKRYPEEKFLHNIAEGSGATFQEAKNASFQESLRSFAQMMSVKVTSVYLQRTKVIEDDEKRSIEKNIEDFIKLSSENVLVSGIKEIYGWNGYENGKIYYFGRYVIDKETAGRQLTNLIQKTIESIENIYERLKENPPKDEKERMSLRTLKKFFELELLSEQINFFKDFSAPLSKEVRKIKGWAFREARRAGEEWEKKEAKTMDELKESLEKALSFYKGISKYNPEDSDGNPLFASIRKLTASLPCQGCDLVRSKVREKNDACRDLRQKFLSSQSYEEFRAMIQNIFSEMAEFKKLKICKGISPDGQNLSRKCEFFKECERRSILTRLDGFEKECLDKSYELLDEMERSSREEEWEEALRLCREIEKYHREDERIKNFILSFKKKLPCTECHRRGFCIQCKGRKGIYVICTRCNGSGRYDTTCSACGGRGRAICEACQGKKQMVAWCQAYGCQKGRVTCSACKGSGYFVQICGYCRGVPRRRCPYGRCYRCSFQGYLTCNMCRGAGNLRVSCTTCNQLGYTLCSQCRGSQKILISCTKCGGLGDKYCSTCSTRGRISVQCSCGNGQLFKGCEVCQGSGVCQRCRGSGHR